MAWEADIDAVTPAEELEAIYKDNWQVSQVSVKGSGTPEKLTVHVGLVKRLEAVMVR